MRLLLVGKDGQVGWELQRSLSPLGTLVALGRRAEPGRPALDVTDADAVRAIAEDLRPQVIVNAAAYTAVDRAESEPERAEAVNVHAPAALAEAARRHDALLVHYSTDYVFDGSGATPWREDSPTGPLGVYGRTKLEGELAIQASGARHLIVRTSWVYAARGGNFARTMIRLAGERERLAVVNDQVGAPTGADLIADVTAHLVRAVALQAADDGEPASGVYHLAAAGQTNWHEYACRVIETARRSGRPVKVEPQAIAPIRTADYPTPAARPLNSRLDCSRLERRFGLRMPPWQDGVDRMLAEILT
ncbi:MAG: dTDP-4-dehydrorhamnose reductase [Ideonella sp.]|jgi:dTDP-4-dehydrorhamnose reductase|nr:dTDP-4-dehydrorhamnose reductase [Ideonella sp.]